MAPVVPTQEDQGLQERGRVRSLAAREPRERNRDLAADLQEGLRQADRHQRAGAGRRAVLGLDRRHPQRVRRRILSPALHAAAAEEHLEPDQPRARRATDRGGTHEAARPATGRRRQGRWPLGRRLCADSRRDGGHRSRRSPRRDRSESARTQDVPDARTPESLRARLSHEQHEDAGRTGRKIASLVAMLARGETIVPEATRRSHCSGR